MGNLNTKVILNDGISMYGSSLTSTSGTISAGDSYFHAKNIKNKNLDSNKWDIIGTSIDGTTGGDQFGWSVAMSADGNVMAIGAPYAGQVKVYRWNGSDWGTGTSINGTAGDQFGRSVAMNADGNTVVIGAPYADSNKGKVEIYKWDGSTWDTIGTSLNGTSAGDQFGYSVAMSADGNTVVIGAIGVNSDAGQVEVYKWDGSTWDTIGDSIDGTSAGDKFGWSVAMSADGNTVAIGAPYYDDTPNGNEGQVIVYKWDGSDWDTIGDSINGTIADFFGRSVTMSVDGNTVAIGAPYADSFAGKVKVYRWDGSTWDTIGTSIDGATGGDYFGWSVAMSADGNIVTFGATGVGVNVGQVKVYKWNGSAWVIIGTSVDGTTGDFFGWSVAMSADGNIVAIGAPYADSNTGRVEVHGLGEYFSNITTRDIYSLRRPVTDAYYDSFANIILEDNDPHIQLISSEQGTASSMIVWTVVDTQDFDDKNFYNRNWAMDMKTDGQLRWIYKANEKASGDLVVPGSAKGIQDVMENYSEKLILEPNGRMQLSGDATTTVSGPTVDPNDPLVLLKLHRTDATGVESWLVDQQFSWGFRVDAAKFHIVRDINAKSVKMTFDNEKVGIGTENPTSTLHIQSDVNANDYTSNQAPFMIKDSSGSQIRIDSNQIEQYGDSLYLNTKTGTNVVIGSGSVNGKLSVYGFVTRNLGSFGYLNNTGGTGTGSGNVNLSIYTEYDISSGILYARSLNAGSDDRLKIEEEYISDATSTLMKLKPQKYYKKNKLDSQFQAELDEWNDKKAQLQVKIDEIQLVKEEDRTDDQTTNLLQYKQELEELENKEPVNNLLYESGLIAQEVFYDAPELRHIVSTGFDPEEISDTPPEGYGNEDPTIDPDYSNWGVSPASLNYIGLIPYLIKSIQEQQELIVSQQTTINDLLSRISALENS